MTTNPANVIQSQADVRCLNDIQLPFPSTQRETPSMRIAIVTERFLPRVSGLVTAVRNLAETLKTAGHDVTVFSPASDEAESWAEQRQIGFFPLPGLLLPTGLRAGTWRPSARRSIRYALRTFDVVHVHSPFFACLQIARIAREEQIPLIVTTHVLPENVIPMLNIPFDIGRRPISALLWKWIGVGIRLADALTSPSNYGASLIANKFGKPQVHVISNGVQQHRRSTFNAPDIAIGSPIRALYVGRLQREKNIDELLRAVEACRRASLALKLTLVGAGPDHNRLKAIARQLQIDDLVHFAGAVPDSVRDKHYESAHLFLMASRNELQCCAALESLAAGKAIIAARAGALAETIPDGVAGRLYAPGAINEIVGIVRELHRDNDLYLRLCHGAAAIAGQHSLAKACSAMSKVYASVSSNPHALPAAVAQ